jgi:hypothetical protein
VDEIQTHAHDAALELLVWWPKASYRQAVANAKQVTGPTPSTYMLYQAAFMECPGHPALKHFKRKMRAWYDHVTANADFYNSLQLVSIV